jgi:WD40 repeat protein
MMDLLSTCRRHLMTDRNTCAAHLHLQRSLLKVAQEDAVKLNTARCTSYVVLSTQNFQLNIISLSRSVSLWSVRYRARTAVLSGHTAGVTGVAFAPTGSFLASSSMDLTVSLHLLQAQYFITIMDSIC